MKALWRPRHRSALVGLIVGIAVELLLGGTVSAAQSTAPGGIHSTLSATQLPPFPSASAPMTVWNAWAQSQRDAIETQPYVEMLASQGLVLRRVFFVNVTNAPRHWQERDCRQGQLLIRLVDRLDREDCHGPCSSGHTSTSGVWCGEWSTRDSPACRDQTKTQGDDHESPTNPQQRLLPRLQ